MDKGPNQLFTQELDTIRDCTRTLEICLNRWDAPGWWNLNDLAESIHALQERQTASLQLVTRQETLTAP
jgi:hypothetical protein